MIWAYSSVDVEYFCTLKYKAPDLSTNGMVEFEKKQGLGGARTHMRRLGNALKPRSY